MISEEEMMDYLNGKMETVKRKDFLDQVNLSDDDKRKLEELRAIKLGITFNSIISQVESELNESGFFDDNHATKTIKLDLKKTMSIAAGVLFILFAGLLVYSNVKYSNTFLANEGLAIIQEELAVNTLNPKGTDGELPSIEESARPVDPIISSVLSAFSEEDYELVLSQIKIGRESQDILEVDKMHLDWMEVQVLLLLDRPKDEIRLIIESIASNKKHYYNSQARALLKKQSSFWKNFVIKI